MKRLFTTLPLLFILAFILGAFTSASTVSTIAEENETTAVKCMIQMTNYSGEGAYIVISLINPKGEYEQTLHVQGKDTEWYSEIKEWWQFYGKQDDGIDALVGATISGGERAINIIKIPKDNIDAGYSIRFETAVEDQDYHTSDVQFELTSTSIKSKVEGTGFIRYVRMMPQ
jgi:hypothetical protein